MREMLIGFGLVISLALCLHAPVTAQTPGTVKWQYWTDDPFPYGKPAIGPDGLIYTPVATASWSWSLTGKEIVCRGGLPIPP